MANYFSISNQPKSERPLPTRIALLYRRKWQMQSPSRTLMKLQKTDGIKENVHDVKKMFLFFLIYYVEEHQTCNQ